MAKGLLLYKVLSAGIYNSITNGANMTITNICFLKQVFRNLRLTVFFQSIILNTYISDSEINSQQVIVVHFDSISVSDAIFLFLLETSLIKEE